MSNNTPLKRKSSIPLEKKLEIYEFEVDENEPKVKQKKKRVKKQGGGVTKNKLKSVYDVKIKVKSPLKVQNKNKVIKGTLTKPEAVQKVLLSKNIVSEPTINENVVTRAVTEAKIPETVTKESCTIETSSPLSKNKRLSQRLINKKKSLSEQKENLEPNSTKTPSNRKSLKKNIYSKTSNKNYSPAVQKMNTNSELNEIPLVNEEARKRILSTKNSSSPLFENRQIPKYGDNKQIVSRLQKETPTRPPTIEVPVIFHNADNANPKNNKTNDNKKALAFTAMSDDENDPPDNYFKSPGKKQSNNQPAEQLSTYNDNSLFDFQLSASTPVKYNYNNITHNDSTIDNCFGFDEPELFEEPLVSPIKICNNLNASHNSEVSRYTPLKRVKQHTFNENEKTNEVPVTQVIKMLKYGIGADDDSLDNDDNKNNGDIKSGSSSNSVSPIFNDLPIIEKIITPKTSCKKIVKPVPRRSYERPAYLRKKLNDSDKENSDDDESEKKTIKPSVNKKKQALSRKEQDAMQKWIKAFNSQCQEIENFDLVVE